MKVCVIQTDNRPTLDYLLKTQAVNRKFCQQLGYDYEFIPMEEAKYPACHPATRKIYVVSEWLQSAPYDVMVFLDSDAWVQNPAHLHTIVTELYETATKQGCISRDPYKKHNTYINSGGFILKVNDYNRHMYHELIQALATNPKFHYKWPFDQHYISEYIFQHKDDFIVFRPIILNKPNGQVIRHNWPKNAQMHADLDAILSGSTVVAQEPFAWDWALDVGGYPNN